MIDLPLVRWVAVCLKRGDQGAKARCENDEVSGARRSGVGVGGGCRHEDRGSGSGGFGSIGVAKGELALEDVLRLVIGMVDV